MNRPNLRKLKRYFSLKRGMFLWYRYYKMMFFLGFLIVVGLGGYFWYNNLYGYSWSDEKKNEFITTHFKATVFKEKAFEGLVGNLQERMKRHEDSLVLTRDLFSGEKLEQ